MQVRQVLLIEGAVNVMISLSKLIVGLSTGSSAIIADAVHSMSDVINNLFAWFAMKVAQSPPDKNHHYGHQKFEQLAVFALASLLCIVAFEVIVNAIKRFGLPVEQSVVGLVVLLITLVINTALTLWERRWAQRLDSAILQADASHTLSDVLSTVVIIIGWQMAALGYYWLDTVFALIVGGIIFRLAFKLFQRAIPVLVDQSQFDHDILIEAVNHITAVKKVRQLRARGEGINQTADVTITVDANLSTKESHLIADSIEQMLATKFDIRDVVVHVEPNQ